MEHFMSIGQNILVATDFSELGQRAVKVAFELAEKLDSKVHLVHVFTVQDIPESPAIASDTLRDSELMAVGKLRAVANQYRETGRLGETKTHNGDATSMILLAAEELRPDLLVLGTHGRRGIPRMLLGSTAESVLRQAPCTVVIVKKTP
jgi:nucleotide-binding universal stress UspA family protein